MTQDCKNLCTKTFVFPAVLQNRPGLSRIDYRIGTYSSFREAMLRSLVADATLDAWTHLDGDDPGIALLEGTAILCDILTFYQELYANEAYLRTAQWKESIADLVKLTGYRLTPGIGGSATFAFEVKGDQPVTIAKGFPVKAQLEGMDKPADFETSHTAVADPALNEFNLYARLYTPYIDQDTSEFYIYSGDVPLNKGDRLLIGDISKDQKQMFNAGIVTIDGYREIHGERIYRIKGSLKARAQGFNDLFSISAYKLGRSFRHFGHNAPLRYIKIDNGKAMEEAISYLRPMYMDTTGYEVTDPALGGPITRIVEPQPLYKNEIPLDVEARDLTYNGIFIMQGELLADSWKPQDGFTLIRKIQNITNTSMTWGSLTGATTIVSMDEDLTTAVGSQQYRIIDIRGVEFQEVIGQRLELRAAFMEDNTGSGNTLYFYGTEAETQSLTGRRLLFKVPGRDPFIASVTDVQMLAPDVSGQRLLRSIDIDRNVNYSYFSNENPIVVVYGNLVDATQGKREKEAILGGGDARESFQTFKIPKSPLTYLSDASETPPEVPELLVYVNDRQWSMVSTLYGCGPKDEVYIVREDANGDSWVQFGDGKTGMRLPSGIDNVSAVYRTGTGASGSLKANTSVQAGGKLERLDKILLPGKADGGSEPESGDSARDAAPGKVQAMDRLVSLQDYESEALSVPGVRKASAIWEVADRVSAITLTVLMSTGNENDMNGLMQRYEAAMGPNRYTLHVVQGKLQHVYLDAAYSYDPAYKGELVDLAVRKALGVMGEESLGIDGSYGLFGANKREFGQSEYASRVEGIIQNVEGVVWAKVNSFMPIGDSAGNIPAHPSRSETVACGDSDILALHSDSLSLAGTAASKKGAF